MRPLRMGMIGGGPGALIAWPVIPVTGRAFYDFGIDREPNRSALGLG